MYHELFVYKILSKLRILKLRIEEVLIFGLGFPMPTLIKNNKEGTIEAVQIPDIEPLLFSWLKTEKNLIETRTKSVINHSKSQSEIQSQITPDCILHKIPIQNFNKITVAWSIKNEYSILQSHLKPSEILPISMRSDVELIRHIIDKFMKKKFLRLKYLEIDFVVHNQQRTFFSVSKWNFSECESLKRFYRISEPKSASSVSKHTSPIPKICLPPRTGINSPIPRNSVRKDKKIDIVDQKISELVKNSRSAKYINFASWKRKLDSGVLLLPNEELFGKILSKQHKEVNKYNSVKEMRNLSLKLAINLDDNKNKRHLQEAVKKNILLTWGLQGLTVPTPDPPKKKPKKNLQMEKAKEFNQKILATLEEFEKIKSRAGPHKYIN